jgi:hypothetical protein
MKKWQIIQIILVAIMFGTSIADLWVENCTWDLVLEISYCTALLLVCIIMGVIGCIQQKELRRLADEYVGHNYPWVSPTDKLPEDGQVVFIAFTHEKGFSVNVSTYKDGVFESYTTKTPDYWMEVPQIQNEK